MDFCQVRLILKIRVSVQERVLFVKFDARKKRKRSITSHLSSKQKLLYNTNIKK